MHELYYWIALRLLFGIGNVIYKNLILSFQSPERIFQADPDELSKVEGVNAKVIESIRTFKPNPAVDKELERIADQNITIITFSAPDYPENLKNIYDPPPFLYVKGALKPRDANAVAVVGSRHASEYGMRATYQICRELASRGITIVSGLARGIDSQAHEAALAARGRTVAVLGSGIDVVYPPENRKLYEAIAAQGALIAEYPLGTEPHSYNFPARNRIISGLALGVLVTEASPKSGSLITARLALDQGRDVFALPGNVFSYKSKGTHTLLRNGARLVEDARDILEELRVSAQALEPAADVPPMHLAPDAQKIYSLLGSAPVQIDQLIVQSDISSTRLSSILLDLELQSLIRQLPGKRFVRC